MNHTIDKNFFPGWTRKSLTFTIDDGNIPTDTKFLAILKPYGIRGTFNLNSDRLRAFSPQGYREFYRGYEIANHCKYHPFALPEDNALPFAEEPFDEATADPGKLYPTGVPGCYKRHQSTGWRNVADTDTYIRLAEEGRLELEKVFGIGNVESFVWPFGEQTNPKVFEALRKADYTDIRKTGSTLDTTGFALPADRMAWSYNANHLELLAAMEIYEAWPDDGQLKFFAFGVHSVDWERSGNWNELEEFAHRYGNRPEDYWYAGVREIFAYEDAVAQLEITEESITNPTDVTLYLKIDGKRILLPPDFTYLL